MTTSIELKDDLPSITPEQAANLMKNYKAICAALLDESDYSTIQDKKHKNKSAWRKLGRAFYLSYKIIDKYVDKTAEATTWYVTVEASTPNGRTAIGIAACSSTERKFAHPEHDTLAIAYTRACNRAISDCIGVGEVSSEEIESGSIEKVFAGRLDGQKI